jgi:hypothetical protein
MTVCLQGGCIGIGYLTNPGAAAGSVLCCGHLTSHGGIECGSSFLS